MIYRDWALGSAVWTQAGNLTTRVKQPHYPQWLLEAPLWTEIWSGPLPGKKLWCVDPADNIRLAEALGTPIGTHWYGWNNEEFDTRYPVYTPKSCFAGATAAMQAHSVHVVPYTNGRLFDPRDQKYVADNAEQFACHRAFGKPYTERYEAGRNWSFVTMDPGTSYWQRTVAQAVGAAQRAGNTSGVYVDQIASMYAESCYGKSRSGGGSRWADGNRATLAAAVQAVGPGKVLISESNAEAYMGSLHAYLALYGFRQCNVVPAFQAVYGGWSVNVGSVEWPSDQEGVRILLAHQWTYGHVMGWTKPSVFLNNAATLAFTRELAQLKVNHSDFLVFGRLMRPPILTAAGGGALPEARWCQSTGTCCSTALVIGQVWMAGDGSLGLALANPSNATVRVAAKLTVDGHTHLVEGGGVLVDGARATAGSGHLLVTKVMAPLSAAVARISARSP